MQAQRLCSDVLRDKYAHRGEPTADAVRCRVARALASVEPADQQRVREQQFLSCMRAGFIPAGRINANVNTGSGGTLINCFVQPMSDTISGAIDGIPGIYAALEQAAETMRRGGGVGYDFSPLRPQGALIKTSHTRASGPVSYLRLFDRSCETVESMGSRRGAQMGVLRCDHPDIEQFIHAKDTGDLANFNLSVGITDAFMQAVESDAVVALKHDAEPSPAQITQGGYRDDRGVWIYRKIPARRIWAQIMAATYDHAEPGVLFLDRINRDNNLYYCETIAACNPCGEQPLPPYGCCCLGSFDLTRFVCEPFSATASFDFTVFRRLIFSAVRMLDNVLAITLWPLPQQREEAMAKRRIGIGFTGLGDALIMLGLHYDADAARELAARISACLRDEAYMASVALAQERGAFPCFDADKYLSGGNFASRLPTTIQDAIHMYGIRNSHLLSIAPAGTISLAFADNVSNGIEPAYGWRYWRSRRLADGTHWDYPVEDHAYRLYLSLGGESVALASSFVTALELSAEAHMAMVKAVAPFIDGGISKTVNVAENYPYSDFQELYLRAWRSGLKGLTTYRPNPVIGAVLQTDQHEAMVHCWGCGNLR